MSTKLRQKAALALASGERHSKMAMVGLLLQKLDVAEAISRVTVLIENKSNSRRGRRFWWFVRKRLYQIRKEESGQPFPAPHTAEMDHSLTLQ